MRHPLLIGMLILIGTSLFAACGSGGSSGTLSGEGGVCLTTEDCESGLACLNKICTRAGDDDSEAVSEAADGDSEAASETPDGDSESASDAADGDSESASEPADGDSESADDDSESDHSTEEVQCGAFTMTKCDCDACQAEANDCSMDTDCLELISCLEACSDQTCAQTCVQSYTNGVSHFNALLSCQQSDGCSEPADSDSDSDSDSDVIVNCDGFQVSPCACAACSNLTYACTRDMDCHDLRTCIDSCQDQACATQCTSQYADGVTQLQSVAECFSTTTSCTDDPLSADKEQCLNDNYSTCLCGNCLDTYDACQADTGCAAILTCVKACPNRKATCIGVCAANAAQSAQDLYDAMLSCDVTSCENEGSDSESDSDGESGCYGFSGVSACLCDACGTEYAACDNDTDCLLLYPCLDTCAASSSPTCMDDCISQYPNGADDFSALRTCLTNAGCSDRKASPRFPAATRPWYLDPPQSRW